MYNFNHISFICSKVKEFLHNIKFSSTQNGLVCYYYEQLCINSWSRLLHIPNSLSVSSKTV
jgi:hypothetical protein